MNNSTNAPTVATTIVPTKPDAPIPSREPRKPPAKEPAIPKPHVASQPPPSFPGINHLASAPAIRPTIIQVIIDITFSLVSNSNNTITA